VLFHQAKKNLENFNYLLTAVFYSRITATVVYYSIVLQQDYSNYYSKMDEEIHASFNDLSNDILQLSIFTFISPPELVQLSTVSSLFNQLIQAFDWDDESISKHPNIYHLIYTKTKDYLPMKYLILKAWIEYDRIRSNKSFKKHDEDIKYPIIAGNTNRLSRRSGVLVCGGALMSEMSKETLFISPLSSESESKEVEYHRYDNLPYSIGAMAGTLLDDRLVLLGGWDNENDVSIDRIISFNVNDHKEQWSIAIDETLPEKLCYASACSDSTGNVFLTGGSDNPYRGAFVSDKCYVRINQPFHFQKKAPLEWLEELGLQIDVDDEEEGEGRNFLDLSYFMSIYENMDIEMNNWISIPGMNHRRCGHVTVPLFDKNCLVSIGGYDNNDEYLKSVELFDAGKEIWIEMPDMEIRRSGPGVAVGTYGNIYVYGGSNDGESGSSSFEMIDFRENIWHVLPSSSPRGYTSACMTSNFQFLVTGGLVGDTKNSTCIDIFDIRMNRWFATSQPATLLNRNSHNCIFVL